MTTNFKSLRPQPRTLVSGLINTAVLFCLFLSTSYAQQQEVCSKEKLTRGDVFSIGEVRTSLLPQEEFQKQNGAEWVLMNGQPLMVQTALSPHLQPIGRDLAPSIPDARGRFLRMANNKVCTNLRDDTKRYESCIALHDTAGDRILGSFQRDEFGSHGHGKHRHDLKYKGARESRPDGDDDDNDDIRARVKDRTTKTEYAGGQNAGGMETRPKNIAVNFYIKICYCRSPRCR